MSNAGAKIFIPEKLVEAWRSEWFFAKHAGPLSRFMAEKGAAHAMNIHKNKPKPGKYTQGKRKRNGDDTV